MATTYPIAPALQWHEGMLLMPEHFQQNDRRLDQLFHFHMSNASPFYWGIVSCKIDSAKLVTGVVSFTALQAVMPDGTIVSVREEEGRPLEVDINDLILKQADKTLMLHLAVPIYRPNAANVNNDLPRYLSQEGDVVVDENTGEGQLRFPTLRPNLLLLTGDVSSGQYISFPVLKIAYVSNSYSISGDFCPPFLSITSDHPIGALSLDLAQRMRQKISFLADRLNSQTDDIMSAEAEDAVRALSRGLLPFEAMLRAGAAHPYDLYVELCSLAGDMTALHPGQMPPSFSTYRHDDMMPTFQEALGFTNAMLDRIQEGYNVIALTLDQRIFKLPLRQAWMQDHLIFGVKAAPGMSEKEVAEWLTQAVIATDRFVGPVRDKRILGATRTLIEANEDMGLLPARGVVLFSVLYDRSFIDSNETLQIFNVADTEATRPVEIVMYVPKRTRDTYF